MQPVRLFIATGDAVARVDINRSGAGTAELMLHGSGAQCVAVDPHDLKRVYVGTFDDGIYRSLDGGASWQQVGQEIPHKRVLSVAISPSQRVNGRSVVFAGTEPSMLYRSEDDGQSWQDSPALLRLPSVPTWSFPPRPWTHHVRWIAPHYHDPSLLFVGIELGGVMRSTDGGMTWEDRKPGSQHDSHAVATHPLAPERVYEAAGGGIAVSDTRGETWRPADEGTDRHYTWGLAIDPSDPDLWYVSATFSATYAHYPAHEGDAQAMIYRKRGDQPWQALDGGLPRPLPYMPYALLSLRECPNSLVAGMRNGELWLSVDAGDSWRKLDVTLPALLAASEA